MEMTKQMLWKVTTVVMLVSVGALFIWQANQNSTLSAVKQDAEMTAGQVNQVRDQLKQVTQTEKIDYQHEYQTQGTDKVITTFFEQVRTYDDSKSYNTRKERIIKANVTTKSVTDSDLFMTDREETGENYIDNTGMSAQFDQARFYVSHDTNGQLKGQVVVDSVLTNTNYEHESTSIYDVTYDKELGQLVDVKYGYGLLKGDTES